MMQPKPKKAVKKYVPTAKEKKNLEDASKNINMRPPFTPEERKKMPKVGSMGSAKNGKAMKKAQNGTSEYSDPTPLFNKIKKSKDSIDNARKILKRKMKKEEENYKSKVSKLKMKNGGSLGMKSVKAGFDNNPGVTRADIIVAAKKEAKSGAKLKKQAATAIAMKKAGKTPKTMKSGGSMKKCRYGCK